MTTYYSGYLTGSTATIAGGYGNETGYYYVPYSNGSGSTAGASVTYSPWNSRTADNSANTTATVAWDAWVEYEVRIEDMNKEERIERRKNQFLGAMHTKFSYWETTRKARIGVNMKRWADLRARLLLKSLLTRVQLERFDRDECIPVDTEKGNRYLIKKGRVKNVEVLNSDGSVRHRLCVHPQEEVPDYDTMIAQLLHLKTDEESLIGMANIHPVEIR